MSLEYEIKKPEDLKKISSNDLGELLWWSYTLLITPEKLLSLIDEFGNSADEIKKHLK